MGTEISRLVAVDKINEISRKHGFAPNSQNSS